METTMRDNDQFLLYQRCQVRWPQIAGLSNRGVERVTRECFSWPLSAELRSMFASRVLAAVSTHGGSRGPEGGTRVNDILDRVGA